MDNNKSGAAGTMTRQPADLEFPAASPLCTVKQRVGLTDVEITYSRPGRKNRQIFGALVPSGKLWRAGANQATKITFSTAVKLNGTDIAAGAYALLAIPENDEWTIIFNKDSQLVGIGKYDEKLDAARIKVKTIQLHDVVETYTIELDALDDESANLNFKWENVKASIKMDVECIQELLPQVEAAMASDGDKKPYIQAALLFLNHSKNYKKANEWIDAAIAERPVYPFYFFKAQIVSKLGDKKEALEIANKSKDMAVEAKDLGFVSKIEALIAELK